MDKAKEENQDDIVEGEILDESSSAETTTGKTAADDQAQILLSLEEMIKANIASTDRLSEEKKKITESLADAFNNDANYKKASDAVKDATKARNVIRSQITGRTGIIDLANKAKSLNAEIREKKQSLSDYLLEYQRMATDVNEIEGYDGEVREIVHVAKVIKKAK